MNLHTGEPIAQNKVTPMLLLECAQVPNQFRLECAQFGAHSFSFHVQDSGTQTGSLSLFSDKIKQNKLI